MILITGASGTVGSKVVRQLTAGGHEVRAMTRTGTGFRADFDDPESLRRAVSGARAVFLLTAPAVPGIGHDVALLDAARAAGVATVVKLSAIGTGEVFEGRTVGAWHLAAEEAVRASAPEWTILRPSSFASNCLGWDTTKPVPNLTGTGRQGVIDPEDVAAVAVAALTRPGHEGRTYTLTGPELLDVPEQARRLSVALGRTIETVDVPPAAARQAMLASGMPEAAVEAIILGSAWARAGHNAVLTDDVPTVLARPARSFADWASGHLPEDFL